MRKLLCLSIVSIIVGFAYIIYSCKKKEDANVIVKSKLSGYVQKGPFINGTTIQMYELNSSLNQTGKVFNTQINNNKGSFEITNVALSSQYVEFSTSGYYYDEIRGSISVAPLTLYALSDITDLTTVNVNLLTHLEKDRVEYLVGKGLSFLAAKDSAQAEIMGIFGFKNSTMDQSEALDISVNKEENAILLAISIILQGDRSVGDLTEILANISADIKTDGKLNDSNIDSKLRDTTGISNNLRRIRSNLEKRYQDLGINVTIPGFEKYMNDYFASSGQDILLFKTQAATNVDTATATLNGIVNVNNLSSIVTFEYGTTDTYGTAVTALQSPVSGYANILVSANLSGLAPGTLYHFRVKSVNSSGTTYGSDLVFTTLGKAPLATTNAASDIFATTVTLHGTVNANNLSTTVTFEYGTTTGYGSTAKAIQSPITGGEITSVTAPLTGLSENTTYHYRIEATNSLGIIYGDDMTFKTFNLTSTLAASNITDTSATLNGIIIANISFTDVSFEYGASLSYGNTVPAIQSPVTGSSSTIVNASVTGLVKGTTYHYRLVAVYSEGTIYGDDITFVTYSPVIDFDGNRYKLDTIGTQVWMTENLKTTKYNDGTSIPLITNSVEWASLSTPAYCWYNNDMVINKDTYGALYNWFAVNTGKLCPVGWHVATDAEWTALETFLGGRTVAAGKMKETGTLHWISPNEGANNVSGFTGLPGGLRAEVNGSFLQMGTAGYWWTSTQRESTNSWARSLYYDRSYLEAHEGSYGGNNYGLSVRCLKGN